MSELAAGRELDTLIAEKVFGVCAHRNRTMHCDYPSDRTEPSHSICRDCGKSWPQVPKYSTDIATAWRVVECIQAKGWRFALRCDGDESFASFIRSSGVHADWALSVPLAICRAALLVVEEGKSE